MTALGAEVVPNSGEWLTVAQVADELNSHPETVRRQIRSGLLPAMRFGGQWRVLRADMLALRRVVPGVAVVADAPRKRGRPRRHPED